MNFLNEIEDFINEEGNNKKILNKNICPKSKTITKKFIKEDNLDYIILDINSLTIVPYLNINDYYFKKVNVTPQVKSIEYYFYLKNLYPKTKFIIVVDNGLSGNAKKIWSEYKENRNHSRKANLYSISSKNNIYRFNIAGIIRFFTYIDEYISYLPGEADFKIGFIINKILEKNKNTNILTISGDSDLILTTLKIKKHIHSLYKKKYGKTNFLFTREKFENCFNLIYNLDITSPEEYLIYKSLIGDKSDNIPPVNKLTSKKAINIIKKSKELYNSIHPVNIVKVIQEKNKRADINKIKYELKRNLSLINIFNEKIFTTYEKLRLEQEIKEHLFTEEKLSLKDKKTLLKEYVREYCPPAKKIIEKFLGEKL